MQRAGTTWWWRSIAAHPGVHLPAGDPAATKERHLFSHGFQAARAAEVVRRYPLHFPRPSGLLVGEWTPRYVYDPWTPRLLAAAAPAARVLVMLRDPVERFRSALGLYERRQSSVPERVFRDQAVNRGLYAGQLALLLSHFDRSRVLVLQYERCLLEPRAELERTHRFLGLDPTGAEPWERPRSTEAAAPTGDLPEETRRDLVERYRPDVETLGARHPEIDLSLWPSFARGAAGAERGSG